MSLRNSKVRPDGTVLYFIVQLPEFLRSVPEFHGIFSLKVVTSRLLGSLRKDSRLNEQSVSRPNLGCEPNGHTT